MAFAIGADDKKKLYLLGGISAAIVVVVVVLYGPFSGSKTATEPAPPVVAPVAKAPTPPSASAPAASASAAPGTIDATSLVSVQSFREDPFMLFARPQLPVLPTPRVSSGPSERSGRSRPSQPTGPVELLPPDQVEILPPGRSNSDGGFGGGYSSGGMGLPPMDISSGRTTTPSTRALVDLPPVSLPARSAVPTTPGAPGGRSSAGLLESPGKRISGVIIGDSVRALLEIEGQPARIVQPGDEIDGIRILRIERITQAGRPVTRLIIRENGEERSVVLKSGPRDTMAGGAGGGGRPGGRP